MTSHPKPDISAAAVGVSPGMKPLAEVPRMKVIIDKMRLWAASILVFTGALVGPREMRAVFRLYQQLLRDFSNDAPLPFGLMMVAWFSHPDDQWKADQLQAAAKRACVETRNWIDRAAPTPVDLASEGE